MINFKSIPESDKPRERLLSCGEENLSNEELIAIILKTGSRKYSVKEVSLKLLENISDICKLKDIGVSSLMNIDGIGSVKAIELKAAIELGRRVYLDRKTTKIKLNSSMAIYDYFFNIIGDKKQEYFYCVYLDTKGNYLGKKCLFIGTINNSVIHPREIFKEAYLLSANGIICVHNHPSGDSTPSREDVMVTRKLSELGVIHGIKIIDHVIIGSNNYYSFCDDNKL